MTLYALSPLDGRYLETVSPLQGYFSEFAYLRFRIQVEMQYLRTIANTGLIPGLSDPASIDLGSFTEGDALLVQEFERTTRHDVKAIEYFLRTRLPSTLHPWIHFGLTSEDINNISQALALRESRDEVMLPVLENLTKSLSEFAQKHRAFPMLARTHGQPAVPTTLGKEVAVFIARLLICHRNIAKHQFQAKLTGAVGNFNAFMTVAPQMDWMAFSSDFIRSLGLDPALGTTQILPYDNWIRYFQEIQMVNSVLIDYAQDIWRYISDGYLKQPAIEGEVGSSTMPQKVNPIDFENAEGNLGLANSLFAFYAQKLAISRLQRDLSDSTVRRTFGISLGHSLLAWQNILTGMSRLVADEAQMLSDLDEHWEIISEGAQTILRLSGRSDAYEALKARTRGHVMTQQDYHQWLDSLDVDDQTRQRLVLLSPRSYIGLAVEITDSIIAAAQNNNSSTSEASLDS